MFGFVFQPVVWIPLSDQRPNGAGQSGPGNSPMLNMHTTPSLARPQVCHLFLALGFQSPLFPVQEEKCLLPLCRPMFGRAAGFGELHVWHLPALSSRTDTWLIDIRPRPLTTNLDKEFGNVLEIFLYKSSKVSRLPVLLDHSRLRKSLTRLTESSHLHCELDSGCSLPWVSLPVSGGLGGL